MADLETGLLNTILGQLHLPVGLRASIDLIASGCVESTLLAILDAVNGEHLGLGAHRRGTALVPIARQNMVVAAVEPQNISSELGVAIIRLYQIPVYLEGNVIDLGATSLALSWPVAACATSFRS